MGFTQHANTVPSIYPNHPIPVEVNSKYGCGGTPK